MAKGTGGWGMGVGRRGGCALPLLPLTGNYNKSKRLGLWLKKHLFPTIKPGLLTRRILQFLWPCWKFEDGDNPFHSCFLLVCKTVGRDWTLGICQWGLMHIFLSFNGYSADFRSIKIQLSRCLFSHLWGLGSSVLSERCQLLLLQTAFNGSFIWICTVTLQDLREGDCCDGDALLFWWSSWINIIFFKGGLWETGSISYTHTDFSSWEVHENALYIYNSTTKYIYSWNSKYLSTIALDIAHGIYEKEIMTFINLIAINMFNY